MPIAISIFDDRATLGHAAAAAATVEINAAIARRGEAQIILATGSSQFELLEQLVQSDVDWSRVTAFHLDEYVGISNQHPASFVRYLRERFFDRVNGLKAFHFIDGTASDLSAECRRLGDLIGSVTIDVACIGIGENGHLAFNDPPADFETEVPYLEVDLDEACRRQQVGEGWFEMLEQVPRRAISMSVQQIMKSKSLLVSVPDDRKSQAVLDVVSGPITPTVPASIIQQHPFCQLMIDRAAASKLIT